MQSVYGLYGIDRDRDRRVEKIGTVLDTGTRWGTRRSGSTTFEVRILY